MSAKRAFEKKRAELYKEGIAYIELEARKILRTHHNLDEFIMCMGRWTFSYKDNDDYAASGGGMMTSWGWKWSDCDGVGYIVNSPLGKFMDEWDESMHFTGTAMRFTAEGIKRTEW